MPISKNKRNRREITIRDFSKSTKKAARRWLRHFTWRYFASFKSDEEMLKNDADKKITNTYKSALKRMEAKI